MINLSYLQVKVKVVDVCVPFIHDGTRESVAVFRGVDGIDRPEPRVVAFTADDDAQLRFVGHRGRDLFERRLKLWELDAQQLSILTLSNRNERG